LLLALKTYFEILITAALALQRLKINKYQIFSCQHLHLKVANQNAIGWLGLMQLSGTNGRYFPSKLDAYA
tara:strand:- start:955 stop:1164 length:210 start_codon:yes stop_codon:yes gene_type:complete